MARANHDTVVFRALSWRNSRCLPLCGLQPRLVQAVDLRAEMLADVFDEATLDHLPLTSNDAFIDLLDGAECFHIDLIVDARRIAGDG